MSYDLMVFDHSKVPHELGQLKQWLCAHMENDVLPDQPPAIFVDEVADIIQRRSQLYIDENRS